MRLKITTEKPATRTKKSFKVKVLPKPPVRQQVETPIVRIITEGNLPNQLAQTLMAWKESGNTQWMTCLEADMSLYAKGLEPEGGAIDINAVRALVFMGYMIKQENGFQDFWVTRYRLSKEGYKALGVKEPEPVTRTRMTAGKAVQLALGVNLDCSLCEGSGEYMGEDCENCGGTGIEPSPEKVTEPKTKTVASSMECPKCSGTGMLEYKVIGRGLHKAHTKEECPNCNGTGEVQSVGTKPKFKVKR